MSDKPEYPLFDLDAEFLAWRESRLPEVQALADAYPPNQLYQIKATGQVVMLSGYSEGGTLIATVLPEYNLATMVPVSVSGIEPADVEPVDPAGLERWVVEYDGLSVSKHMVGGAPVAMSAGTVIDDASPSVMRVSTDCGDTWGDGQVLAAYPSTKLEHCTALSAESVRTASRSAVCGRSAERSKEGDDE